MVNRDTRRYSRGMTTPSAFSTAAFRDLVDKALRAQPLPDGEVVEQHFKTAFADIQPANRWEKLYEEIGAAICMTGAGIPAMRTLSKLQRSIFYEEVLGLPVEPYQALLRVLADAGRNGTAQPFSEEGRWLHAITAARALIVLNGELPARPVRETVVREAARRLIARGARLGVGDGRFAIDPNELKRLASNIDLTAAGLGGLDVVAQTVHLLVEREPFEFGRYAPGRSFGFNRTQPSFPYGYLLQLAVKHLSSPPAISSRRAEIWRELVEQAMDLCAVIDVEPYLNTENIVPEGATLPEYLASIALFDHLFALKQWPPSRAADLLRDVTAMLDAEEIRNRVGWDIADVLNLLEGVLATATGPCAIITPARLIGAGLSEEKWELLRPAFVHALKSVNTSYESPLDADKAEFDFKPLFELRGGHLLVVTPSLASLAFYEATTRALRSTGYPDLENHLAKAMEKVLAGTLRRANVNVSVDGTKYFAAGAKKGETTGECDVVVETDTQVIFLEIKKQPLRRVSATGDAAAGLVDLTASLFAAQGQCAGHEEVLLREDALNFENGYTLERRGRSIDRFAMTWLDYGGLQDKLLLDQIFTALIGRRVGTDHPKEGKKLEKLNEAIAALEGEVARLQALGKDSHALFINCWFISVPQLAMLLDGVNGPAEFDQRLTRFRHMSLRTLDFYRDFAFARSGRLA